MKDFVVDAGVQRYVEREIIPRYRNLDAAHRQDHVRMVIERSLTLARMYGIDETMAYVIAAYHDIGLSEGREQHHIVSGRILWEDEFLKERFSPEQRRTMVEAVEDHRASSGYEPRTIYGKIVAEADRMIVPNVIIRRTIRYGLAHYPDLDKEGHYRRLCSHLQEKYAEGGYLKLWLPESENVSRLEELRRWIRDAKRLRQEFEQAWSDVCRCPSE